MTSSLPATDTTAPVGSLDTARAALRRVLLLGPADPAATAARAQRRQRRNEARADRAHRLAVARFGAYPAGRSAGSFRSGAWGD